VAVKINLLMTGLNDHTRNSIRQISGKTDSDISIFWMRRDLRLSDNTALYHALATGIPTVILYIFDDSFSDDLSADKRGISFVYDELKKINSQLSGSGAQVMILNGDCLEIWKNITSLLKIRSVTWNNEYEPYAIDRDRQVSRLLEEKGVERRNYKDRVIFEKGEIVKDDSSAYKVFTSYRNKWLDKLESSGFSGTGDSENLLSGLAGIYFKSPLPGSPRFQRSKIKAREFNPGNIEQYHKKRDYPGLDATTFAGPYLRYGTISIRKLVKTALMVNRTYLDELIWREFFMQILYHYPAVVKNSFKIRYDSIKWLNDEHTFNRWCLGKTGYPIVDAGMRQLNKTGYMHNRVRMISAGFLCRHLLCDWRWGEKYFAERLLDYELASNNGNWQWAAGSGCDASPYFRVFNPYLQAKKFDPDNKYINDWLPEYGSPAYSEPVIDHKYARKRAIETYKYYLDKTKD